MNGLLIDDLARYIGQTVTIFTTSGGCSGQGFTGVLAFVGECTVKLITAIGAPPACPIGNSCAEVCGNNNGYGCGNGYGNGGSWGCSNGCGCGGFGSYGNNGNYGNPNFAGFGGYFLGSVAEIPISRIACFTHNAI